LIKTQGEEIQKYLRDLVAVTQLAGGSPDSPQADLQGNVNNITDGNYYD
jgi:hypothetical protein